MNQRGSTRQTRRTLLAAAAGGVAAVATGALIPAGAAAADGDPVLLGQTNDSAHTTHFVGGGTDPKVWVEPTDDAIALRATARHSFAILADSDDTAIAGQSLTETGIGVRGGGIGAGTGVAGSSDTGDAVRGFSNGVGVHGQTNSGVAVRAEALTTGTALAVDGPVSLKSAGIGTVPRGARAATVASTVVLHGKEKVLVTLMSDPGHATLQYAKLVETDNSIEVHLIGPAPADVLFAWFVIS
jgi:hypothetical protein